MTRRAYYKKTIYYDETFVEEMELFEKLIMHDPSLSQIKLQNDTQRFSVMLRIIIRNYNRKYSSVAPAKVAKEQEKQ